MSLYDYHYALMLHRRDAPFQALLMAAMLKADTFNVSRLMNAWPEIYSELDQRYHAPGGAIDGETPPTHEELQRLIGGVP